MSHRQKQHQGRSADDDRELVGRDLPAEERQERDEREQVETREGTGAPPAADPESGPSTFETGRRDSRPAEDVGA